MAIPGTIREREFDKFKDSPEDTSVKTTIVGADTSVGKDVTSTSIDQPVGDPKVGIDVSIAESVEISVIPSTDGFTLHQVATASASISSIPSWSSPRMIAFMIQNVSNTEDLFVDTTGDGIFWTLIPGETLSVDMLENTTTIDVMGTVSGTDYQALFQGENPP